MDKTENNCGIYGIKNTVNGLWYIGQTITIRKRRSFHFWQLSAGVHHNRHLQKSFTKHGKEAFEFHILEIVHKEMLDQRERDWIAYYKSNARGYGYNCESGGVRGKTTSKETSEKISKANTGRKMSPESVRKARETFRKNFESGLMKKKSSPNKGKHLPEEWRKKLSIAAKERWAKLEERAIQSARYKGIPQDPEFSHRRMISVRDGFRKKGKHFFLRRRHINN